jgi:hypothetical protein
MVRCTSSRAVQHGRVSVGAIVDLQGNTPARPQIDGMSFSLNELSTDNRTTDLPEAQPSDFVSLTMPVEEGQWRWPRDLHPFFRQNLPEGFLLSIIREDFGPVLDGTDLSLLAVGGMGIGAFGP